MNAGFSIKVKAQYDLGMWTLSTTDPKIEITADEFGEATRDLLKEINEKVIKTIDSRSRISVMQGEIKASISQTIDIRELSRSQITVPMDDVKISTSIHVIFSQDRSLDEFQRQETKTNLVLPDGGAVSLELLQKIADKVGEVAERTGESPSEVLDRARAELDRQKAGAE